MFFFPFFDLIFFSFASCYSHRSYAIDLNDKMVSSERTDKRIKETMCRVTHEEDRRRPWRVCTREKTKTNNQTKTNKICFEKETHDSLGNTTMTMSTTTTQTTPSQVSYYRRVHSLPSISQQSKRGNVIHGARATGASKSIERKTDRQKS